MIENTLLKQLILQHSVYNNKIYDNTSILRDLKIESETAVGFIKAYSKEFDVDISSFNFTKYFPLDNKDANKKNPFDLTVGDLIRGIRVGELNDNIITFEENDPNLPPKLTARKIIFGIILVLAVTAILSIIANWL